MKRDDAFYRLTASGEDALSSDDVAIPVDYRRILCLIEGATHVNIIRGRLRKYSDELIADWLDELKEIGFIVSVRSDKAKNLDLEELVNSGLSFRTLGELPEEKRRVEAEARNADASLRETRTYLATDRLQNRKPLSKTAEQSVVLLVEDDPDQAALADLRVSMAGYGVRLARSRRELIRELVTRPAPDLVLLDVMLPDGNGFDILAGMRRHPKFSVIPVIMLTSMTGEEDIQRGLSLGADGYVTKPFSKSLLVDTIGQVLRHA